MRGVKEKLHDMAQTLEIINPGSPDSADMDMLM